MTNLEEACEDQVDGLRGTMSEGQLALEALVLYRAHGLQPPEWALATIEDCYETFRSGAPPAGWSGAPPAGVSEAEATRVWKLSASERQAPKTLDEAFGVEAMRGNRHTNYNRGALMPRIRSLFTGPDRLPRTDAGYEDAASRLGVEASQVRLLVAELPKEDF